MDSIGTTSAFLPRPCTSALPSLHPGFGTIHFHPPKKLVNLGSEGNLCESMNDMEKTILSCQVRISQASNSQQNPTGHNTTQGVDGFLTLAEVEERHIRRVLAACGGRVGWAARSLDISRSSLYQKVHRLGLKT